MWVTPTVVVVMLKVCWVAPVPMKTEEGVPTDPLLSLMNAVYPPLGGGGNVGAGDDNVMVPVLLFPPTTVLGLMPKVNSGCRVSDAVREAPFKVTVTCRVNVACTSVVVTAKNAVVAPPLTVTEDGVETEALLSEMLTTEPPGAASLARVTVAWLLEPPLTVLGFNASVEIFGIGINLTTAELVASAVVPNTLRL